MGRKGQDKGWRGTLAERFERLSIPEPNTGCLLWIGAAWNAGYGRMRNEHNELVPATHIALQLNGRQIPKGMQALHRCDNPYCVNADHLFIGDQQMNVDDMRRKGRANYNCSGLWQGNPKI